MNVHWVKCGEDGANSCPFILVQLDEVFTTGVYIIWHTGAAPNVVYVGQGVIAERINEHRLNPDILYYQTHGELLVTWAEVHRYYLDGVERFLANMCSPLVGDSHPNVVPISVDLPQ